MQEKKEEMKERIQKIIAAAGVCSRRKAEELIKSGKVKINGEIVNIGESADIEKDIITINGKKILKAEKIYFMFNKPKDVVCTLNRQGKQKIITDYVKTKEKIFPVGRLDKDTTGLLLLTNDGNFANSITHPSKQILKTYEAELDKKLDKKKLQRKIIIEGREVKIKDLEIKNKTVKLKIHEGRKHIVKKIFEKIGYKVIELKRTAINSLKLDIPLEKYRKLKEKDFIKLGVRKEH